MAGLYLHIPFCRRKCLYCDFYSVEASTSALQSYPGLLIQQLNWVAEHDRRQQPFDTVYFGGGTPSLLDPAAIARILTVVDQRFGITRDAEISLEANPGTVCLSSLQGYRASGINRLSLGLQSCQDEQLLKLGRLHNCQEGQNAVAAARQSGFNNLSLDLMFALPGQTLTSLGADLEAYLELSPEHLSCYGLTVEPQTQLEKQVRTGEMVLPDDDFYAEAFMLVDTQLSKAGYNHYEIANYARPGFECQHNSSYWKRRPYLGIGAGAHSFCAGNWGSRWEVPCNLDIYLQNLSKGQDPQTCLETFDRDSALSETVYLALRTRRGVVDSELQQHFGCTLSEAFPEAVAACSQWLVNDTGRWSMTPSGWLLFDRLIQQFLR